MKLQIQSGNVQRISISYIIMEDFYIVLYTYLY